MEGREGSKDGGREGVSHAGVMIVGAGGRKGGERRAELAWALREGGRDPLEWRYKMGEDRRGMEAELEILLWGCV